MQQSADNKTLRGFLDAIQQCKLPDVCAKLKPSITQDYADFSSFLKQNPDVPIYGLNRLPGHRDGDDMPEEYIASFQRDLVKNHQLPFDEAFDTETGRYVTLSKIYAVLAGGSLVSPDLLDIICKMFEDRSLTPIIPLNSSYSSGDVIPAAHWAGFLLKHYDYELKPGEGMALINGSFVHVGLAVWLLTRLDALFAKFLTSSQTFFRHISTDEAFFEFPHTLEKSLSARAVSIVSEFSYPPRLDKTQAPVSVRSTPQMIDASVTAISNLANELEYYLFKPSGNPQIRRDKAGMMHVVSSGSFVNPSLSLAISQVMESLLMISWLVTRRVEFFLSGQVEGVSKDASSESNILGLIQWPKLIAAKGESLRLKYGRRPFSSFPITSYGVEDFSSHGLTLVDQSLELVAALDEVLSLEYFVFQQATSRSQLDYPEISESLADEARKMRSGFSFTS